MFRNRTDAGEKLAEALAALPLTDPLVLALPRGGVPVALPVARRLKAPLDLLLVRKIGLPGHPELAAGALLEGAEPVFNDEILALHRLSPADFEEAVAGKRAEIATRRALWLAGRAPEPRSGRSLVVVDDGIATGATMRAALRGLADVGAKEIVLAVPVAAAEALAGLRPLCDRAICLQIPLAFYAVGAHYEDFPQVGDDEVARMLAG